MCLSVCLFVCVCVRVFSCSVACAPSLASFLHPIFCSCPFVSSLYTHLFSVACLHFARPPNSVHNPLGVLLLRLSDKMHLMHKESTEPSVHLHLRLSLTTKSSTQQGAGVEVGSGKMHVGLAKTSRRILRTIEVVPRFWVSDSLRSSSSPAPASAHPPT